MEINFRNFLLALVFGKAGFRLGSAALEDAADEHEAHGTVQAFLWLDEPHAAKAHLRVGAHVGDVYVRDLFCHGPGKEALQVVVNPRGIFGKFIALVGRAKELLEFHRLVPAYGDCHDTRGSCALGQYAIQGKAPLELCRHVADVADKAQAQGASVHGRSCHLLRILHADLLAPGESSSAHHNARAADFVHNLVAYGGAFAHKVPPLGTRDLGLKACAPAAHGNDAQIAKPCL